MHRVVAIDDAAAEQSLKILKDNIVTAGKVTAGSFSNTAGTILLNASGFYMGDLPIENIGYLQFNLSNGFPPSEGRMIWNDDEGTVNLGMKGGVVNLQVGQESIFRARNYEGSDISNGQAVRLLSGTGSQPTIDLANATDVTKGASGLATENIADNQFGYVTTQGLVRGDPDQPIDTSSWPAGTALFLDDTDGGLTSTIPIGTTSRIVFMGVVIRQHITEGVIWVSPINTPFLPELSGMAVFGQTEGQIVSYDAAESLWKNKTPTVETQISLSMYDAEPARASESNIHGGLLSLATAQPLPTNIVVNKGIDKIMVVVNAGSDISGDIIITGESIDRDTGASTPADTDTLTVDALTTDTSDTDSNGNTRHAFSGAYISSKWFTGTVTLSTANLTLTDVDVYHVSFEQEHHQPSLKLLLV